MTRRNAKRVVDGEGIKAGQAIEAGVTIAAPIVVGAAIKPVELPSTLKSLGALPEVEATQAVHGVSSVTKTATADVRKFGEYIFTPNSKGKEVIFKGMGYSEEDSAMLAEMWEKQAAEKFSRGEYVLGRKDQFGQRVNIEIQLKGVGEAQGKVSYLKSGWMINEDGSIKLTTPFSGFTK